MNIKYIKGNLIMLWLSVIIFSLITFNTIEINTFEYPEQIETFSPRSISGGPVSVVQPTIANRPSSSNRIVVGSHYSGEKPTIKLHYQRPSQYRTGSRPIVNYVPYPSTAQQYLHPNHPPFIRDGFFATYPLLDGIPYAPLKNHRYYGKIAPFSPSPADGIYHEGDDEIDDLDFDQYESAPIRSSRPSGLRPEFSSVIIDQPAYKESLVHVKPNHDDWLEPDHEVTLTNDQLKRPQLRVRPKLQSSKLLLKDGSKQHGFPNEKKKLSNLNDLEQATGEEPYDGMELSNLKKIKSKQIDRWSRKPSEQDHLDDTSNYNSDEHEYHDTELVEQQENEPKHKKSKNENLNHHHKHNKKLIVEPKDDEILQEPIKKLLLKQPVTPATIITTIKPTKSDYTTAKPDDYVAKVEPVKKDEDKTPLKIDSKDWDGLESKKKIEKLHHQFNNNE